MIFVAGIHRQLDATGQLGFHAVQNAHPDVGTGFEQSLAYAPYGIVESFLRRVAQVPASSMWYPTRAELIDAHVLDAVTAGGHAAARTASDPASRR